MGKTLIVGAGLTGLAVRYSLIRRGVGTTVLERETRMGGRLELGHHRLYSSEARSFLAELLPSLEWEKVDEAPMQIRKGEWEPFTEEASEAEQSFLRQPFFQPLGGFRPLLDFLGQDLDGIKLRTPVAEVDLDNRRVITLNGTEFEFARLIWTASLASLTKACGRSPQALSKIKKRAETSGGLTLDIDTPEPLFSYHNTVVFPFRFKDERLRALGVQGVGRCHWSLFLDETLLENREELAKVVRTFKREMCKQFPAAEKGTGERIAFHSILSPETPISVSSLEVFEGVVCLGEDVRTEPLSPSSELSALRGLDQALGNALDFLDLILPKWLEAVPSPASSEDTQPITSPQS